jgi:hypothetical protein
MQNTQRDVTDSTGIEPVWPTCNSEPSLRYNFYSVIRKILGENY